MIAKHGEGGITEYGLADGVARISGDTQMTLFMATGILTGTTRGIMGKCPDYVWYSYRYWCRTQTESSPLEEDWLAESPPGNTCLAALGTARQGILSSLRLSDPRLFCAQHPVCPYDKDDGYHEGQDI